MFVTLFCALIESGGGSLTYVNAGHNPALLYRPSRVAESQALLALRPTGMALGILEDAVFEERTLQLQPRDWVLLYTDGVTDAQDPKGQAFGLERLERLLLDAGGGSAGEIVSALEQRLRDHTGPTPPYDDITLLVAQRIRS
jgi:phosphoserine phosphatase RsbU/P